MMPKDVLKDRTPDLTSLRLLSTTVIFIYDFFLTSFQDIFYLYVLGLVIIVVLVEDRPRFGIVRWPAFILLAALPIIYPALGGT